MSVQSHLSPTFTLLLELHTDHDSFGLLLDSKEGGHETTRDLSNLPQKKICMSVSSFTVCICIFILSFSTARSCVHVDTLKKTKSAFNL